MSDFNRVSPIGHPEANGPDSHIIKLSEAKAMIAVNDPNGPEWKRVRFCLEAIFDLAKQPGARFLDIHPAHNGHHGDRKSTRLNSSHIQKSRMPSSA